MLARLHPIACHTMAHTKFVVFERSSWLSVNHKLSAVSCKSIGVEQQWGMCENGILYNQETVLSHAEITVIWWMTIDSWADGCNPHGNVKTIKLFGPNGSVNVQMSLCCSREVQNYNWKLSNIDRRLLHILLNTRLCIFIRMQSNCRCCISKSFSRLEKSCGKMISSLLFCDIIQPDNSTFYWWHYWDYRNQESKTFSESRVESLDKGLDKTRRK